MLVLQCGLAPDYVLDRMKFYEMRAILENIWMKDKESWEQTKKLGYITAQVNSSKPISPDDIMTFPWDSKEEKHIDTEEEIESMKNEMKNIENQMNNK